MVKFPVRIDTMQEINDFVAIATTVQTKVTISDDEQHAVNGKSLLGCIYSMEFAHLFVTCEECEASKFDKFRL